MYILRKYETDCYGNFQGYRDSTYFDKELLASSLKENTNTYDKDCFNLDESYVCIVDLFEPEKSIKVGMLEFLEDNSLRTPRKTLKEIRKFHKYKAKDIAKEIKVNLKQYYKYETGKAKVPDIIRLDLTKLYHCSIYDIKFDI